MDRASASCLDASGIAWRRRGSKTHLASGRIAAIEHVRGEAVAALTSPTLPRGLTPAICAY
jgi:hypothetical protein